MKISDSSHSHGYHATHRRQHHHHAEAGHQSDHVTSPAAFRANRDVSLSLRAIKREGNALLRQTDNPDAKAKVEELQKNFTDSLSSLRDEFTSSGSTNYLEFAQKLAVLRQNYTQSVREIGEAFGVTGSLKPTTTTSTPTPTPTPTPAPAAQAEPTPAFRAARDERLSLQAIRNQANALVERTGSDDIKAKVEDLQNSFVDSLSKLKEEFTSSGSTNYLEFAQRLAVLRQNYSRSIREIGDSLPTATASAPAPTTNPAPSPAPGAVASDQNSPAFRAKRDTEISLTAINNQGRDLIEQLGGGDDVKTKVENLQNAFRDALSKLQDDFGSSGSTNYLEFAQKLAVLRQNYTHSIREIGQSALASAGSVDKVG
ncbi:MAG: hypothetical protein AB7Q00_03070 [Phycisphaerales bacterium]